MHSTPWSDRLPPWTMAVTAMLLIQVTNAISVPVIDQIGAAGATLLRMLFAAVLLWVFVRPAVGSVTRADIPLLLLLGGSTGLMMVSFFASIDRIPLGTAVAIEFLGPLTVAALSSKRRSALIWPALAFVGILLLTEPWLGEVDLLGVVFALSAGVFWALYIIFTQRASDRFSGITALTLTIPVATVAVAIFGVPELLTAEYTWWVVPLMVIVALVSQVIAYGLELLALRRMNKTAFGTLLSLEPAMGVLVGLIFLMQQPSIIQVLGIVIVVIAGAAAQRDGLREPQLLPPS